MGRSQNRRVGHFLREARYALGMSQAVFGPTFGSSHRTAVRWEMHRSAPIASTLRDIAARLLPVDRGLAEEAARWAGGTLESLGLVAAPAPPAPAAPAQPVAPAVPV